MGSILVDDIEDKSLRAMQNKRGVEIKVGQIWMDMDKRMRGRKRKVVALLEKSGLVVMDDPRADFINKIHQTKVSAARMHAHSTGWMLCSDDAKGVES